MLDCVFRRTLAVAEEAGNGSIEARRFCVEECKRSNAASLQSASDVVDTRLQGYATLDELGSVRELVQTAAKLAASAGQTLAVRFADSEVEDADHAPTLNRSAMREEVRRYTTELHSHVSGLKDELRALVQGCTHDVEQLQTRLHDSVGELRNADQVAASQISALDRRIGSTIDPLLTKMTALSTAQREGREELRDRTTAQLDTLRQHVDGKLQVHETNMLRMSREMSGKFEEHRRSCDDVIHEVGTNGEIARGQIRQDLRAELETLRVNQRNEMEASVSQAKTTCLDSVEALRDRWMQRDSEIIEALRQLQDSVETRLRDLEGGSDGRFAGIRMEMDQKLAAMSAEALDHRETIELQMAEAKRQLTQELALKSVSTITGVLNPRSEQRPSCAGS
eukprot:COSAG02_NODE_3733_length_6312_cov_3.880251_7_plen_395_part_00